VLYECVTGEKPPEVLERLHGSLGTALADGHWPGFSKRFLQAIDAGMTIKPSDRPQSIHEWLALFGKKEGDDPITDDEATRFFAHEVASDEITPVAPPAPGYEPKEIGTQVPDDPKEVEFKRAGEKEEEGSRRSEGLGRGPVRRCCRSCGCRRCGGCRGRGYGAGRREEVRSGSAEGGNCQGTAKEIGSPQGQVDL
jgi:hypothetical protein